MVTDLIKDCRLLWHAPTVPITAYNTTISQTQNERNPLQTEGESKARACFIADCNDIGPLRLVDHVCFFRRATREDRARPRVCHSNEAHVEGASRLGLGDPTSYGRDYLSSEVFRITIHAAMLSSVHLCCNVLLRA